MVLTKQHMIIPFQTGDTPMLLFSQPGYTLNPSQLIGRGTHGGLSNQSEAGVLVRKLIQLTLLR